MKIRCRRDKFVPLFTLISSFTATRDVRPALQNVKMIADEKSVVLTATDGGLSAKGELSTEEGFVIESAGEAILPAKLLRKILAETTDDEISLELKGTMLAVNGANFHYQLATWPSDDFPTVAPFEDVAYHKIATKSLIEMIRRTSFATDAENSHYVLGGVLFNFEPDLISAVSTDGRRLAYQKRSAEAVGGHTSENKTIFPPRTLSLLERAAADVEEAWIAVRDGQAVVQLENVVISTTLMEGRFPNWRAILPNKSGKIHVDFIAGQLASAVRQAEIVATEKKPGVWFHFEQGKVCIAASGEEVGESNVEIPIAYDGEKTSLRLDSKFLNDFLRCVSPEETLAFYFQPDTPALFETTDDYSYVVMPLT
jgi:DNA polymerase-3 subunit beta